jgi:hypothetical protein
MSYAYLMALPSWLLVFVGGRHSQCPGPLPTLGSFGPSNHWRHKQACFFTKFSPVHVQKPRIERQKKLQPVPKPVISKPTRPKTGNIYTNPSTKRLKEKKSIKITRKLSACDWLHLQLGNNSIFLSLFNSAFTTKIANSPTKPATQPLPYFVQLDLVTTQSLKLNRFGGELIRIPEAEDCRLEQSPSTK